LALIAFARTFYLRTFFEVTDLTARLGQQRLPWHVVVHAISMTVWLLLFCTQAWMVALGNVSVHRRLGVLGVAAAAAVVLTALFTTLGFVPRVLEAGGGSGAMPGIVVRDLLSLVVFAAFVGLAVHWRTRPAIHKRLMLLASVVILGQAYFRQPAASLVQLIPDPLGLGLFLMGSLCFVIALIGHDYLSDRRIHGVTTWAGATVIALELSVKALVNSGAAESMANWLSRPT
jgi:hypothetical protein